MSARERPRLPEVFARFLRLGCSSFGGPVAHLGYFRREFVERAGWLDDATFGEIVALCSALPGPTSSQVGMLIGAERAGWRGGLLAWLAFTSPSAVLMTVFGVLLRAAAAHPGNDLLQQPAARGALDGLAGAAAAVVALAVVGLARTLTRGAALRAIALLAFAAALAVDRFAPQLQWLPLLAGGVLGVLFVRDAAALPQGMRIGRVPAPLVAISVTLLAAALIVPAVVIFPPAIGFLATLFRAGALVFGGGHVVLPFLQNVIDAGLVPFHEFFAGYAAAQIVPGPLFTFAAFLGADNRSNLSGALGAFAATLAIFAPSFLLLVCALPLWQRLRSLPLAGAALAGINASVVGLLAAVLVDPIAKNALGSPLAVATALVAFALFMRTKAPAWLVVPASAAAGALAGALGAYR
jgi:chromate transporter